MSKAEKDQKKIEELVELRLSGKDDKEKTKAASELDKFVGDNKNRQQLRNEAMIRQGDSIIANKQTSPAQKEDVEKLLAPEAVKETRLNLEKKKLLKDRVRLTPEQINAIDLSKIDIDKLNTMSALNPNEAEALQGSIKTNSSSRGKVQVGEKISDKVVNSAIDKAVEDAKSKLPPPKVTPQEKKDLENKLGLNPEQISALEKDGMPKSMREELNKMEPLSDQEKQKVQEKIKEVLPIVQENQKENPLKGAVLNAFTTVVQTDILLKRKFEQLEKGPASDVKPAPAKKEEVSAASKKTGQPKPLKGFLTADEGSKAKHSLTVEQRITKLRTRLESAVKIVSNLPFNKKKNQEKGQQR